MKTRRLLSSVVAAVGISLFLIPAPIGLTAQQTSTNAVRIDSDDIGGIVTSAKGL